MSTAKERERILLYQVFPQDVLRPQVQFFLYICKDLLVGKYHQTLPYRQIITNSLRCPWGKEALKFSLNSTHLTL